MYYRRRVSQAFIHHVGDLEVEAGRRHTPSLEVCVTGDRQPVKPRNRVTENVAGNEQMPGVAYAMWSSLLETDGKWKQSSSTPCGLTGRARAWLGSTSDVRVIAATPPRPLSFKLGMSSKTIKVPQD